MAVRSMSSNLDLAPFVAATFSYTKRIRYSAPILLLLVHALMKVHDLSCCTFIL